MQKKVWFNVKTEKEIDSNDQYEGGIELKINDLITGGGILLESETTNAIKQVLVTHTMRCGVCNSNLMKPSQWKDIFLYNEDKSQYIFSKASLFLCPKCQCFNAVKGVSIIKSKSKEFKASVFNLEHTDQYYPYITMKRKATYQKISNSFPTPLVPLYVTKQKKILESLLKYNNTIYISNIFASKYISAIDLDRYDFSESFQLQCPICLKRLTATYLTLYSKSNFFFRVIGSSCGSHFFTQNVNDSFMHLVENKTITLNFNYNYEMSPKKGGLNKPLVIYLKNSSSSKIVIAGFENRVTNLYTIIDYRNYQSRMLITKVFHDKVSSVSFEDELYDCIRVSDISSLSPYEIIMKKNAGIVPDQNCEMVDILLYSPYTKTYEICHASYNSYKDVFSMDIALYRNYVRKYGNPEILLTESRNGGNHAFSEWKEESLLHWYGYTVDQKTNLTTTQRQQILAEIIDLQLLTKERIISHLTNCVNVRKKEPKYKQACKKWNDDIDFVSNYCIDIERFIIAK